MEKPEITKEHEDIFSEIIELCRILELAECDDISWFSFDIKTMKYGKQQLEYRLYKKKIVEELKNKAKNKKL